MLKRYSAVLTLALVVVMFVFAGLPAAAAPAQATAPGAGPDRPLPLPAGTTPIKAGQRIWYSLQYAGDSSQITIDLTSSSGTANFGVWTQDGVNNWAAGNGDSPIGNGTDNAFMNDDMTWSGNFNFPGPLWIAVDGGSSDGTFTMKVTGSGVSMPTVASQAGGATTATGTAAQPAAPAAAPAGKAAAGSGPDNALPLPGGPTNIKAGQRIWYAFQYAGDVSQINVEMTQNTSGTASFGMWTPAGVQNWKNGAGDNMIGMGTPNADLNSDPFWSGNFDTPGTYWITVDGGSSDGTFTLKITGSGVTFPTVAAQAGGATTATGTAAQPAAPAAAPASKAPAGTSPEHPAALPSGWQTIAPGQRVWYAFQNAGDGSQVNVQLTQATNSTATFGVWTQGGVQNFEAGNGDTPVGMGTSNPDVNGGDLWWSGNFSFPGTYFIVVDGGANGGGYLLQMPG